MFEAKTVPWRQPEGLFCFDQPETVQDRLDCVQDGNSIHSPVNLTDRSCRVILSFFLEQVHDFSRQCWR